MTVDLAHFVNGTPGRFVPAQMQGELVEVEHLARYWWATPLARGRRVLDAGCGLGYGSLMLADAGAKSVTAVDVAPEIVEVAREQAGDRVRFEVADLRTLSFDDDAFDLVICFEVIEHLTDQELALDELRRVLAPNGLVVVSSPNPDVNVPGNPHHVQELRPSELQRLLSDRWPAVDVLQQFDFEASGVLSQEAARASGSDQLESIAVRKLQGAETARQPYSIAVAGDVLPEFGGLVLLTSSFEVRNWVERFAEQQRILEDQVDFITELQRQQADHNDALSRLVEAETELAEVPTLRERARLAETALHRLSENLEQTSHRAERAELINRDLQTSLSWRLTKPLRRAKRLIRR